MVLKDIDTGETFYDCDAGQYIGNDNDLDFGDDCLLFDYGQPQKG